MRDLDVRVRQLMAVRVAVVEYVMAATSVLWMRLCWHIRAASMSRIRPALRVHA